jgi:hypothetical protein
VIPALVLAAFVAIAVVLWLTKGRRKLREVTALRDALVAEYASKVTAELVEGERVFKLRAVRDTELGRSTEDIAAQNGVPSASPELVVGDHATFELESGVTVELAPGSKLTVRALPNAKRRVVEHTTTPGGMRSTVTFEIPAKTTFELYARWDGAAHASYRDREARRLDPASGGYWLSDRRLAASDLPIEGIGLTTIGGMAIGGLVVAGMVLGCLVEFLEGDLAFSIGAAIVGAVIVGAVAMQVPARGELLVQAGARWRPVAASGRSR